jgi:hypothetical protein
MNQFQATPGPVSNTPLVIMVAAFPVSAPGRVFLHWDTESFDFFGAAPSADVCISIFRGPLTQLCPIPEPATGGLLALGLAALTTAARRRTR